MSNIHSLIFLLFLWLMGGFLPANASPAPAQCDTMYMVHDNSTQHSQLLTYRFSQDTLESLGNRLKTDIEGLAIHPDTHQIYASTGQTNAQLYQVDGQTGELSLVGEIGYDDVVGLAFHPDGTLWGMSALGLLQIDLDTGAGTLVLPNTSQSEIVEANPVSEVPDESDNGQNSSGKHNAEKNQSDNKSNNGQNSSDKHNAGKNQSDNKSNNGQKSSGKHNAEKNQSDNKSNNGQKASGKNNTGKNRVRKKSNNFPTHPNFLIEAITWNSEGTLLYGIAKDTQARSILWQWAPGDDH